MNAAKLTMSLAARPYVGLRSGVRTIFRSDVAPTEETHPEYGAVIGPFRTVRAARLMARVGGISPHCVTVADAERMAAEDARAPQS